MIVTSGDAIRVELKKTRAGTRCIRSGRRATTACGRGLGWRLRRSGPRPSLASPDLIVTMKSSRKRTTICSNPRAHAISNCCCANPDIVVRVGDDLVWCAGAVAQNYEKLGGRVVMAGKPFPPIYDLAYRELETLAGTNASTSRASLRSAMDSSPM